MNGEPRSYSFENGHGNLATDSSREQDEDSTSESQHVQLEKFESSTGQNKRKKNIRVATCTTSESQHVQHQKFESSTGQNKKKKNQRLKLDHQETLLEVFSSNTHPTVQDQKILAEQLGLSLNTIKFWFQNNRNKDKVVRSQKEMQIVLAENERLSMNIKQLQTIISNCTSCTNQYVQSREADISANNVVEPPINGIPVPLPMCPCGFQKQQVNMFEKNNLNMANAIIQVAFNEITRIASEANMWLDVTPTAGLFEGFLQKFRLPPQPGMRVETSLFSAIVPLAPDDLVQLMMNVDKWTSALSPIVYHGSLGALTAEMESLTHTCTQIQDLQRVDAEFQLPAPLVEARKFSFLRYKRKLANGWAIVDISEDCVHLDPTASSSLQLKCFRRPSGLIIKPLNKDDSQVVWIENVEVFESKSESIYSPLIMSHLPFGAKRWISTLLHKLRRNKSEFALGSHFCREAREDLLNLAETMVMDCLSSVSGNPDNRKWQIISHQVVRLMEKRTVSDVIVSNNIISASRSFHLPVKPQIVFDHIANKSSKSQWRSQLGWIVSEELIKLVTNDRTNNISLYKKVDGSYLFQEALSDDLFSFVISAPMTEEQTGAALSGKWTEISLHPSGFMIMPDGSDESSGSLVTISIQINADPSCSAFISNLIMTTINNLVKEITELQITEMLSK